MPPFGRMFGLLLPLLIATPYVLACPLAIFPSTLNGSYSEASLMEQSIDPILPSLHARNSPTPKADVTFQICNNKMTNEKAPKINPDREKFHDRDPTSNFYVPAEIHLTTRTVLNTFLGCFDYEYSNPELEYQNDFPYNIHSLPLEGAAMFINIGKTEEFELLINDRGIAGIYDTNSIHATSSLVMFPAHFTGIGVSAGGRSLDIPRRVSRISEKFLMDNNFNNLDLNPSVGDFMQSEFTIFSRARLDFKNDFPNRGDDSFDSFDFIFENFKGPVSVEVVNGVGSIREETSQDIHQGKKRARKGSQSGAGERPTKKAKENLESNADSSSVHPRPKLIEGN
ncbi:hypothetical protein F5880DRAFT_1614198 [Lentinula raphanica]|nr:hypothetical protein F5880DRAFT_1614198 [Lentinula raphanica]